ncbi:MAG: three-Cys-motif partner protein TcmP [Steroidobacteraceae bacterium]
MADEMSRKDVAQKFGGPWTIMKVEMVVGYLEAFTKLLLNKPSSAQPFKRVYIDGFAGSGSFKFGAITTGFFKRDATEIAGSAQRALSIYPPFDALHFIEKRPACLKALRKMVAGNRRVTIHEGDANAAIRKLCCEIDWRRTRGVIFLDPFGASLEWETLKVIAATKALDVWYLFPLSSVFRNAPHALEKLTSEKRASITKILGTLAVAKPRRLLGPKNVPLFSLFFAVSNPYSAAIKPALRIAAFLLGRKQ